MGHQLKAILLCHWLSCRNSVEEADAAILKIMPQARIVNFGHLGDGNLHYNISQPENMSEEKFMGYESEITEIINGLVAKYDGTFCAEHGIGQIKKRQLEKFGDGVSLKIMRRIKKELDPKNIMNPGKIFDV